MSRGPIGEWLPAKFGRSYRTEQLSSSPGSLVWLVTADATSVVVKRIIGPNATDRFGRELAALRLAADAQPPLTPLLLDANPDAAVLVLEYLEAPEGLPDWVSYAQGLARLHATAIDAPAGSLPQARVPVQGDVEAFLRLSAAMGLAPRDEIGAELYALVERLSRAPRNALLHGDPCLGNVLPVAGTARFIDFEQTSLGDGLTELAYLRIGFPTCGWVDVLSERQIADAESAYHETWRNVVSPPVDDRPCTLTDHCVGWLIRGDMLVPRAERGERDQFARLLGEDWRWGPASARQRLAHRLGVAAGLATDTTELSATGRLAAALRNRLLTRWPDARTPW